MTKAVLQSLVLVLVEVLVLALALVLALVVALAVALVLVLAGVVVLAGALLEQAEKLLDRGLHPVRVAEGFEAACQVSLETLEKIADTVHFEKKVDDKVLVETASTTLSSKIINVHKRKMALIAARISVSDTSTWR